MKHIKNPAIFCGFALLLGLYSSTSMALKSDSEQPITIDSNTATYDDSKAISIYTGNVISIQGSIKVHSDKLVVHFVNGDAEKLVFTGNKAKFRQKPSEGEEDITGEALIGEYYPKKNLLILIDEATVWQGNATYSSKLIEYDSKNSVVRAGEKSSDSKRVRVILKPKPKEAR
ncbi:lipopolysaccharide transport periplasmic protein LptA [Methylobacter marinus]|uniref:lipopolysaccharide transport periplasmic protein LptA n=1 Tax=Methylobacter marinus TaxID=34058 RepID=UPI000377BAF6|nr:lipopolysaccharide transport periplasmic protein LptA [Methylobacter marinus]